MGVHAYRGRFAPSPTGPLHLGSLCAALISWAHARQHQGSWAVRIDDLDTFRCDPKWSDALITTLAAFGLESDTPIQYQSQRSQHYQEALHALAPICYHCTCPRKSRAPGPYPGTCRHRMGQPIPVTGAIRVDCTTLDTHLDDVLVGRTTHAHPGDPIIRRADGLYAYQLACTVDDHLDRITHVIRGCDLLESTLWQRHLTQRLIGAVPKYGHFPVLTDSDGQKLSKQQGAEAIDPSRPGHTYRRLATILRRPDPPEATAPVSDWLAWWLAQGPVTTWWSPMHQNIPIV